MRLQALVTDLGCSGGGVRNSSRGGARTINGNPTGLSAVSAVHPEKGYAMADDQLLAGGADEISRKLREVVATAQHRADSYSAVRQQVQSTTISEQSSDGSVRVTVSASGSLTGLELSERLTGTPPADIARTVMAAVRRAQGRIADQVRQIAEDNGVGDDPATTSMLSRFAEQFPPDEEPAEDVREQKAAGQGNENDYWDDDWVEDSDEPQGSTT